MVLLRQHRIQLRPRGMAILFKGESATRRNTEKAAQRVLRHGLSSLAPINSRELNERMRSASTYNLPTLNRGPLAPSPSPFRGERVPFLSERVSLSRATAGAHFWGFVGFLIKGAVVTPMARMRGIARGISSKNLPPPTEAALTPSRNALRLERSVI